MQLLLKNEFEPITELIAYFTEAGQLLAIKERQWIVMTTGPGKTKSILVWNLPSLSETLHTLPYNASAYSETVSAPPSKQLSAQIYKTFFRL